MTPEIIKRCIYIIKFGIMPWDEHQLPLEIDDWLMPVFTSLIQIQNEHNEAAQKR